MCMCMKVSVMGAVHGSTLVVPLAGLMTTTEDDSFCDVTPAQSRFWPEYIYIYMFASANLLVCGWLALSLAGITVHDRL